MGLLSKIRPRHKSVQLLAGCSIPKCHYFAPLGESLCIQHYNAQNKTNERMRVFNRVKGDEWPAIELLVVIPSSNLKDGKHKLDDIVITSENGDAQLLPGAEFEVKTYTVPKPNATLSNLEGRDGDSND